VTWKSSSQKYQAGIRVNGRNTHVGLFDTVAEAAQAHARAYFREHGGPPAPPALTVAEQFSQEEGGEEEIDLEPFRSTNSAGYRGVSRNSSNQKYKAEIKVDGHRRHLGLFDTVEEAAQAYARAYIRKHGGPPAASPAEQFRKDEEGEEEIDLEPFRSTNSAGYRGVCWNSSNRQYHAQIKVNGQQRHLGLFDTVEEASRAYARAYLREHGGPPAQPAPSLAEQMAWQKAQPSGENDEEEQEASSLRPAKRARVATAEEGGQAPAASALGKEDQR